MQSRKQTIQIGRVIGQIIERGNISPQRGTFIEYMFNDPFSLTHTPKLSIMKNSYFPDFYFEIIHSHNEPSYSINNRGRTLTLYGNLNNVSYSNILFLLLKFSEKFRQEKKMYTAHAASIEYDKKGVLICGPSRSGKTLLMLKILNEAPHGFMALTDEFTIINEDLDIVDGVGYSRVIREYHGINIEADPNRVYPLERDSRLPLPLKLCVYVRLYSCRKYMPPGFVWRRIQFPDNHLLNYETFSQFILSVNDLFGMNYDKPFPYLDNEYLSRNRAKFVAKLSHRVPTFFYEGSVEKLFEKIQEVFEE